MINKVTYFFLFILVFLASCTGQQPKYRIGVSQCAEGIWREQMNDEIFREALLHSDVELMFRSSKDDAQKQIEDIEELIRANVDALIISPTNATDLVPIIEKAYDKGIPVVLVDRKINSEKYSIFVGVDNRKVGSEAANYILTQLDKQAVIVEFEGDMEASPVVERHEGFVSMLQQNGVKAISLRTNWHLYTMQSQMDSLLTAGIHPDAIFCHNDFLVGRLSDMFPELRKHTLLIGVDALANEGAQYIIDGKISASVEYQTCGIESIRAALDILYGNPVGRDLNVSVSMVDKDNAQTVQLTKNKTDHLSYEIYMLSDRASEYLMRYNLQQLLLGASLLFILILSVMLMILVRNYRTINKLNQRLEKVSKARVSFFTNVSHDFRTPLTLIADPIRQLRASTPPDSPQSKLLDIASKNVTILLRLINQVLDFRKCEEGKMEMRLAEFNLKELLMEWTEGFVPLAETREFNFRISCPEEITMVADPEMLERITYNLLSNAFKYTPTGGNISVTVSTIASSRIQLAFTDSGKGMSEHELSHVFEDFYQANVHYSGTGIGLAVVKAFVDMHHGQIGMESRPNQGTTVRVVLPQRQEGPLTSELERSPIIDSLKQGAILAASQSIMGGKNNSMEKDEKPTLLVVDDSADVRSYIRIQLEERFSIIEAQNGQEGLEMAFQQVPDIIIMDVMMPVMDGIQAAHQLKSDMRTSHIPIIMLTASTSDETQIASFQGGTEAFMSKPFCTQVLQARIYNLLAATAKRQQVLNQSVISATQEEVAIREEENGISAQDKQFVAQLRAYLTDHLGESELHMDNLGSQLGLSYTQLYRKTKSLTGTGPTELLRIIRLERAKELLLTSSQSVSEISYGVGFTSPSYFTKCYREYYGITPREQRGEKKA